MPLEKIGFEDSLKKLVVPELCVGCGSCVAFCPMKCLEYSDGLPRLVGRCTECGICFQVCPSCGPPQEEIERLIFGRERRREEEFGVYRRVVVAQTTDRRIREVCQDGGLVTSLLTFALEEDVALNVRPRGRLDRGGYRLMRQRGETSEAGSEAGHNG
ncbi:hypothetical protein B6U84_06255 [Candidatus Bathyarchaeota archaeon ex4484_40]|nr:MAG: hypothetical protein B6U84_06255 [Candidatus Bathyarchaeota archaeon ex4484_40]